jgi:hypothetical protein
MDTLLLRVHQRQIVHQCRSALLAADMAHGAVAGGNQDAFWSSIQNFLTATANIAKALWGAGGSRAAAREPLRLSLGVADDSALASTRLRNHFEHYDERLDQWFERSAGRNYVDFVIGPENVIAGADATDIFRWFDPDVGDVIFWGERYSIAALVRAVRQLLPIAEREAKQPHWATPSES